MNTTQSTRTRMFIGLQTNEGERISKIDVIDFLKKHLKGGTFYDGRGLWQGDLEKSLVFECVDLDQSLRADSPIQNLEQLKKILEEEFKQDSVMVERTPVQTAF